MYHVQPMLAGDSSCATPRPRMCCREEGTEKGTPRGLEVSNSTTTSSIYLRVSEKNNGGQTAPAIWRMILAGPWRAAQDGHWTRPLGQLSASH